MPKDDATWCTKVTTVSHLSGFVRVLSKAGVRLYDSATVGPITSTSVFRSPTAIRSRVRFLHYLFLPVTCFGFSNTYGVFVLLRRVSSNH